MKVAFVSFDFGEYCVRLANALARDAEVLLLLPEREANGCLHLITERLGLRTFHKPRLRQPLAQLRTIAGIFQAIRHFNPDVVHLQSGHLWFNAVLPLLRRYPLVVTIHDPERHAGDRGAMNTPQWVLNLGYRQAAEIIVHARQMEEALRRKSFFAAASIHVIPQVYIGDDRELLHIDEDPNLILFFGRIWKYKGLDYLIRAEPLITARAPQAKFLIAGEGESFDRYRRLMVHPDRFEVRNEFVSDGERAEMFRRASVVVLPYIEATQSGVIPLAYRFGKPVVATDVGGLPAMVVHGRTGFLVPPADERALGDAIVTLLDDPALRHQLGANGRSLVNTECSPDVIARKTLEVYRKAAQKTASRAQDEGSHRPALPRPERCSMKSKLMAGRKRGCA